MMTTSESIQKIAPALFKIQSELKPVVKSGTNTFHKYNYATLENHLDSKTLEILFKYECAVITHQEDLIRLEPRSSSKGSVQYPVQMKLKLRLIHSSGEWMEIDAFGEGADSDDKGVYKATTGARKYGLAALFNRATTDDPENDDEELDHKKSVSAVKSFKGVSPVRAVSKPVQPISTAPHVESIDLKSYLSTLFKSLSESTTLDELKEAFRVAWNGLKELKVDTDRMDTARFALQAHYKKLKEGFEKPEAIVNSA